MKKPLPLIFVFLISSIGLISLKGQTGMKALLPTEGEIRGWNIQGETIEFKSDELTKLNDKDADIVNELGFKQLITATVVSDEGDEIKLEIYRMTDSFAAFGLFLQNNPGNASEYDAGNNCFIDANSLGFWKQHYFALLKGSEQGDSVTLGMKILADLIDSRIRNRGRWPEIFTKASTGTPGRVTLIRGKIALSNIYHFTSRDIFRIKEGIAIENQSGFQIWFRYESQDESVQRWGEVAGFLSREGNYTGFKMTGDMSFALLDWEQNAIEITSEGKYLRIEITNQALD